MGSPHRRGANASPLMAGSTNRGDLCCAASCRTRRNDSPSQRSAARPDVLRSQGPLAARPPSAGPGARESRRDLPRDDRRFSSVALWRRGSRRGRQRFAYTALRCRRGESGTTICLRFSMCLSPVCPVLSLPMGHFRRLAVLRRSRTELLLARCSPTPILPFLPTGPLPRAPSRRRRARAPRSWASSTVPRSATVTPGARCVSDSCVAAGPVDARLRRQHPQRRRDLDLGRGTARNLRERARRARRHCSRTRVASPSCPPSEALARRGGTPTPPRPRLASRLARRARLLRELLWIRLPTRLPMWWTPSAQAAHQSNGC